MASKTKYRWIANPELAKAMAELRRSSAAGAHKDRRTRKARTRSTARARSIRDSE